MKFWSPRPATATYGSNRRLESEWRGSAVQFIIVGIWCSQSLGGTSCSAGDRRNLPPFWLQDRSLPKPISLLIPSHTSFLVPFRSTPIKYRPGGLFPPRKVANDVTQIALGDENDGFRVTLLAVLRLLRLDFLVVSRLFNANLVAANTALPIQTLAFIEAACSSSGAFAHPPLGAHITVFLQLAAALASLLLGLLHRLFPRFLGQRSILLLAGSHATRSIPPRSMRGADQL